MTMTPFQKFLSEKGIRDDTAALWGVVAGDGDTAIFPYPAGRKTRGNLSGNGKRTFKYDGESGLYRLLRPLHRTVFLCEGESDCLRLSQELADNGFQDKVSVVGLSGINGWKQEYAKLFDGVERIRVILDNDEDYSVRATVDKAYNKMVSDLGRQRTRRIFLPEGTKDICEFFQGYSFASFLEIAKPNNKTNYDRLDLSAEPPLAEWLVEGLICKGDVALVAGPPGIGKSLLAQMLSIAVVSGSDRFLGKRLHATGPVMYLDKENAPDVIYSRLRPLELTPEARDQLHYYYRPDVYLDRAPENLLDDAQIIKPALIVLDSLIGFHTKEEDKSGPMRQLFQEGIVPLARETGAAVIIIHHTGKSGETAYKRIRGSGDIQAAADNVIELTKTRAIDDKGTEREAIKLYQDKTRRASRGGGLGYFIDVNPIGEVELTSIKDGF